MPDGFNLLSQHEPRLPAIADEVIRFAHTARSAGQDEPSIRTVLLNIMLRITATNPLVGPKAAKHSKDADLLVTLTAAQVVWKHLASIAGVSPSAPQP
jgi:hypothetical protein